MSTRSSSGIPQDEDYTDEDSIYDLRDHRHRKRRKIRATSSREGEDESEGIEMSNVGSSTNEETTPEYGMPSQLRNESGRMDELAFSFVRAILGLENKYQILNKNFISKVLEAEGEKGTGIQFKRDILIRVNNILRPIFAMYLVPLASNRRETRNSNEEYIMVNELSERMKERTYIFFKQYTGRLNSIDDLRLNLATEKGQVTTFGKAEVKPATEAIQKGFKLMILSVILLHNNNISQADLLNVLDVNFNLHFQETKPIDILGNLTISQFISLMTQQEYIQILTTKDERSKGKNANNGRRRKVSTAVNADNSLLIYGLGRRALTEFSKDSFIAFFKNIYGDWDDDLQKSAEYTLKGIWSDSGEITTESTDH
ncbi:hypothetical protein HII13_004825 [Brettanomyces bruxellensis]|uniref:DEBR0S2_21044g1_1 n=1 Tax=Dekkera bruxellensis TaxID=5007 RepID=A0A7D9H2E0_DEKBR|nr:hypothetical protein HII13_004825 [Brettanomyces bruxellensis]KAF6010161.1 hypothetical protein HII12_003037 [Brettanomyces bruxellensis]VUG17989.1 DEBR0S2_21044g1_1 [Brettanomyces bruxellensis]